ncbi:hypothetical protein EJB05_17055 [Eragrostis curvula]|uniref:ENTH domain-containing protein n=1 Tax=Eragrostis curvula TaxID=38414 RepID=A0A5J9VHI5_9POAL|nr:hypothetical protein EJB05_17055 [Eragrostis curvula]
MDFMKVLDQTVREIKREVNLKVLKVPEIEQKVLDATSDEPWGPHGSDLADIARATKRYGEYEIIMNVLWQRLGDTGANWRHVYKALTVIEYLLANGTERAVGDIIDNSSQIAKFTSFEYVEPNGKDVGLNVRKKAETVLAIIDDREKLQQVREKAAATRDKYFGLSSTGITYKSGAPSFASGGFSSGRHYGSTGSSWEADSFRDSYRSKEWGTGTKESVSGYSSSKREEHGRRNQNSSTSHSKPLSNLSARNGGPGPQNANIEDDDDFNPRGSSSGTANESSENLDIFGPSLMDDLVNVTPTSTAMPNVGPSAVPEVDLFAHTAFQSANAPLETANGSHPEDNTDLFAGREFSVSDNPMKSSDQNFSLPAHTSGSAFDPSPPSFGMQFPSDTKFSVHDTPSESSEVKCRTPDSASFFDPFAAIPLKSFDEAYSFGVFSSNTGSVPTEPRHDPLGGIKSSDHSPSEELDFGAFTSHSESPTTSAMKPMNKSPTKLEPASMPASKSDVKKGTFQVKSGVWADSLSRGLIDLNITAPKKVDLSDVGVVGRLSDGSDDKGSADTWYIGRSSFPSSGGTNFQQRQFGNFQ